MTKKDLVRDIAADMQLDQNLTGQIVQRLLDRVIEVLMSDGRIELRNFGVLEVRQRAPRKARNPKTNQQVLVPAKRVVTFQAGKNVTKRLQQSQPARNANRTK